MKCTIYTEDSTDGFNLLNMINKIYFKDSLSIKSTFGVSNILKYDNNSHRIMDDILNEDRNVLIILDESPGNADVSADIFGISQEIYGYTNIKLLLIKSFEFEMLNTIGIEYLTSKRLDGLYEYRTLSNKLLNDEISIEYMINMFKNIRKEAYDSVIHDINSLLRRWITSGRIKEADLDFEISRRISLERLSKKLYNLIFPDQKHRFYYKNRDALNWEDHVGLCYKCTCCKFGTRSCRVPYKCKLSQSDKIDLITSNYGYSRIIREIENSLGIKSSIKNIRYTGLFELSQEEIQAEKLRKQLEGR